MTRTLITTGLIGILVATSDYGYALSCVDLPERIFVRCTDRGCRDGFSAAAIPYRGDCSRRIILADLPPWAPKLVEAFINAKVDPTFTVGVFKLSGKRNHAGSPIVSELEFVSRSLSVSADIIARLRDGDLRPAGTTAADYYKEIYRWSRVWTGKSIITKVSDTDTKEALTAVRSEWAAKAAKGRKPYYRWLMVEWMVGVCGFILLAASAYRFFQSSARFFRSSQRPSARALKWPVPVQCLMVVVFIWTRMTFPWSGLASITILGLFAILLLVVEAIYFLFGRRAARRITSS